MKKIVLLLAVLLFGAGSMMAQQDKSAEKAAKQAEKEAKKAEKAAKHTAAVFLSANPGLPADTDPAPDRSKDKHYSLRSR